MSQRVYDRREMPAGLGTVAFEGRAVGVRVDPVVVGANPTSREVVLRVPAVAVVAEDDNQHVVMVRQYRWAVQSWLWELPAGKVEGEESPVAAARRELEEETGWRGREWRLVGRFYPSPGYTEEAVFLFYARGLSPGRLGQDRDEAIEAVRWPVWRVRQALAAGEIQNGIAWLGLLWWLSEAGEARGAAQR